MVRSRQRNFACSSFSIRRHSDMTFVPDRMLVTIDTASLLFEPNVSFLIVHLLSICTPAYSAQIGILVAAATAGLN